MPPGGPPVSVTGCAYGLVGCSGFNSPFKQYFTVYIGPSPREREKEKRNDR